MEDSFPFPSNLSENPDSINSLDNYWMLSVLKPIAFAISTDSTIVEDEFDPNGNYSEIEKFDIIHSIWYGRCSSFVLKKPRNANEKITASNIGEKIIAGVCDGDPLD